jgi:hypothetical protein
MPFERQLRKVLSDLQKKVVGLITDNASAILTAGGVVGTVATAVLTGRAAVQATYKLVDERENRISEKRGKNAGSEIVEIEDLTFMEKTRLTGVYFIPPVLTGSVTIGSIVMANRMSAQKAAALAAAYGLSQKQLEEYKDKVAEKLGIKKQQDIQDSLAQDRVNNTPGSTQILVVEGEVLCFDQPTGRYFRSTMEGINRAVNATNAEITRHGYADANFFYEELGLPPTTWTTEVGWNSETLMDVSISTVLSEDGKPCIAIDFKYLPTPDFIPQHY